MTIQTAGETDAAKVDVDGDGRFTFTGKPGQTLTVRAEATDYEPATESVTLAEGASPTVTLTLRRKLPSGQIRGLIRSFKGDGLDAEVKIEPGDQTLHTQETADSKPTSRPERTTSRSPRRDTKRSGATSRSSRTA